MSRTKQYEDSSTSETNERTSRSSRNKSHRSRRYSPCHCGKEYCPSDRTECPSSKRNKLASSLNTDFRRTIYSKYEDFISVIFSFEENLNQKIENNQNEIKDLVKKLNAIKSSERIPRIPKQRTGADNELIIKLQELKIRHEQEKEHIIREINENFKDVVENFEINLNKLVKALDNYLEQTAAYRKKTTKKFEDRFKNYQNSALIQLQEKSSEIHRLHSLIEQHEKDKADPSAQRVQERLALEEKEIYDMIEEIHELHKDICRKYRKFSEEILEK